MFLAYLLFGLGRTMTMGFSDRAVETYIDQLPLFALFVAPLLISYSFPKWVARCLVVLILVVPAVELVVRRYESQFEAQHAQGECKPLTRHHPPSPWSSNWVVCTLDQSKGFVLGIGD